MRYPYDYPGVRGHARGPPPARERDRPGRLRALYHLRGEVLGPAGNLVQRWHAGGPHLQQDFGPLGEHRHPAAGAAVHRAAASEDPPVGGALSMTSADTEL